MITFPTIVHAIIGRNVYEHLKKFNLLFIVRKFCGNSMCITCFFIYFATPFYPARAFMNLITDSLPAIAIGMERNDQNVLKYPPKKMNLF